MEDYRSLTLDEVAALERQGCTAEDWSTIYVAEDFLADTVTDTHFYGEIKLGVYEQRMELEEGFSLPTGIRHATLKDVTIGDNCLIEGVGCYIHRYDIGDECYISNVGKLSCAPDATFGQGNTIAVLNEGGEENVTLYAGLSPQVAALMALYADDRLPRESLRRVALRQIARERRERGQIGYRSKIVSATEITNAIIGEDAEIYGVSRLAECTILSTPESSTYLGHDVIIDNSIVQAGASVLDGAKISNSLVGEACHVGKGASMESTLLFANSHIDNGETCAAFCGPFTVSHHKSSLLIGGMYSFYNAGSGTNYSNHAYKMGPIHWGTLRRGCKTASGAHVAWPATIGAFSMCMGKILTHPNVEDLPFSYLFGMGDTTYIVPGRNLCTVGTYRDIHKWPKRDMRPRHGGKGIIDYDWLSPLTVKACLKGKKTLETLRKEEGENVASYHYQGCVIKNNALQRGIKYYDMAIRLFLGQALDRERIDLPGSIVGTGEWMDLGGMLLPQEELESLTEDIKQGTIASMEQLETRLRLVHSHYDEHRWNFAYKMALDVCQLETMTDEDARRIRLACEKAEKEWKNNIRYDAEREFQMGDVAESALEGFLSQV